VLYLSFKIIFETMGFRIGGILIFANEPIANSSVTNFCYNYTETSINTKLANTSALIMEFYKCLVIMILLGRGNALHPRFLKELPRLVHAHLAKAQDARSQRELLTFLRECVTTRPIQFEVVGIRISWAKAGPLIATIAIPFLTKVASFLMPQGL
jgi:hypothetical protein